MPQQPHNLKDENYKHANCSAECKYKGYVKKKEKKKEMGKIK